MSLFQVLNITADNLSVESQLAELASMRIATITMPDKNPKAEFSNVLSASGKPEVDTSGTASTKTTLADEFISMILAKRAYETNVRVFNLVGNMYRNALEIGK